VTDVKLETETVPANRRRAPQRQ